MTPLRYQRARHQAGNLVQLVRPAVAVVSALSLLLAACADSGSRPAEVTAAAPEATNPSSSGALQRYVDPREPGIVGPVIRGDASEKSITVPNGDPVKGAWSGVINWPLIGIHAILLPSGKLLTYGTDGTGRQGASFIYDVWDPALGTGSSSHTTLPNSTAVDAFCSSQMLLARGDVQLFGGDVVVNGSTTNTPNQDTLLFRPSSNSLSKVGRLERPRWYSSAVMLPTGEVMIQGGSGGNDRPEIRGTDGQQRLLSGVNTSSLHFAYPRNFVAPDGTVFGFSDNVMYRIDPTGNGTFTSLGTIPGNARGDSSTSAVYAPGRAILMGGGSGSYASNEVRLIDFRAATPVVTSAPAMSARRHLANASVLADGRVAVFGGAYGFNAMNEVAYNVEIYNPASNSWVVGPAQRQARLYHSTSILLPDATVLSLGGGAPGPQTNLNGEIYFPSYLYKADGTPAKRPTISGAPTVVEATGTFILQSPEAASITRVTLVKTTSVTHSHNMDQRFVELSFARSGSDIIANLPANPNDVPPGFYMVFVFDSAGVPSVARMVRMNAAPAAAQARVVTAAASQGGPVMIREFSGNQWKPWASWGGSVARAPQVANDANGEWYAVFAHDANGRISRRHQSLGSAASTWTDTGLAAFWPPAATAFRGQAWLGWVDWFQGIRVQPFDPIGGVGMTWELGGGVVGAPTMVTGGDGLLYVLVKSSSDAQVQFRAFNGGYWTPWTSAGGYPDGDLSATPTRTGIQLVMRGTDGMIWLRAIRQGVAQDDWERFAGALAAPPKAAFNSNTPIAVGVLTGGTTAWGQMNSGGFSGWTSIDGSALEVQSALTTFTRDLEVVVRNSSNQLWSRQRSGATGNWGSWTPVQ